MFSCHLLSVPMGIFCLIFLVNQLMEMSGLIGFLKGKGNKFVGVNSQRFPFDHSVS